MTPFAIILATAPSLSLARKIAKRLIQKELAACVQISPAIESIYKWKGQRETTKEVQLWIKAKRALFHKIQKEISGIHPYEVPEIISISIDQGSKAYLNWLKS
jgi:periplasmic divalent cation tolerance protein